MDFGFRRNDGFWTFDEFIKLRFPAFAGMTKKEFCNWLDLQTISNFCAVIFRQGRTAPPPRVKNKSVPL
jgi:hypothetical protein